MRMKKSKKILIVEDEVELVEMVKMRLEANGYEVVTAYNGEDGLLMARREKPDMILLDLMLPKMDGYQVCGILKKDKEYAGIPICMFTARAQESEQKLGMELGADAYITKPFEPPVLLAKIKELIGE
jgi:two-component system, OmpR family, alkaline phosphatase synthesis response regulator PhoP